MTGIPPSRQLDPLCIHLGQRVGGALVMRITLARRSAHFDFLRSAHRNPQTGGYAWMLSWRDGAVAQVLDATNHCYGLAFVLLAYAHGLRAGITDCRLWLHETWDLIDAVSGAGTRVVRGRGWTGLEAATVSRPNANMHACEALIAAYERPAKNNFSTARTGRALDHRTPGGIGGRLDMEHYHEDWSIDWTTTATIAATSSVHGAFSQVISRNGRSYSCTLTTTALTKAECAAPRFSSTPRWRRPGMRSMAASRTALRRTEASATATSTTGFKRRALRRQPCFPKRQAKKVLELVRALWDYCWEHFVDHRPRRVVSHPRAR